MPELKEQMDDDLKRNLASDRGAGARTVVQGPGSIGGDVTGNSATVTPIEPGPEYDSDPD